MQVSPLVSSFRCSANSLSPLRRDAMRGGVLTMLALIVAVSSAFSPTALAPRSAVSLRVRSVSAPVAMAGWNDEYQTDDPGRKREVRAPAHALSSALCDAHRPRACLRARARARARRHAITHALARTHTRSRTLGRCSRPTRVRPISMRKWRALARWAAWTVPRRPSSDLRRSSSPTSSIWWWQAEPCPARLLTRRCGPHMRLGRCDCHRPPRPRK